MHDHGLDSIQRVDTCCELPTSDFREPEDAVTEDFANRLIRRVLAARSYRARVEQWAAQEIRRCEREEAALMERHGGRLRQWTHAALAAGGGGGRFVALPAGRLGFRRVPDRLVITDVPLARTWCSIHRPEAIKVTAVGRGAAADRLASFAGTFEGAIDIRSDVSVSTLQSHLRATGEMPAGTTISFGEDDFYVR